MIDPSIFSNPRWHLSRKDVYPNVLGRLDQDDGTAIGGLWAIHGRGRDFGLGVKGMGRLLKAQEEGRITTGYVVLAQRVGNGGRPEFIAAEYASVVYARVCVRVPLQGPNGPFWWLTREFMPAASMAYEPDAPL